MIPRLFFVTLAMLITINADATTIVKVQGRIVDEKGNPVACAQIASWWFAEDAGELEPQRPAVSSKDGRFLLELELYNRDQAVMAIDAAGKLGGVATVLAKSPGDLLEISAVPLVETRVRHTSENTDRTLRKTYVTWSLSGETLRVAGGRSNVPEFVTKLAPGLYTVRGGESCHIEDVRGITLEAGKPADLGEVKLPLTNLTKLFGKPDPALHVTDARGVSDEVQAKDFIGKWIVLEFWGYWCGPCTQRGLPGWMDFVEAHAADRDKFVILSVHDPQATDFAMLDEKLAPIIQRTWQGRELSFPILLDTSGRFVADYGVRSWPTAILLDPVESASWKSLRRSG